MFGTAFAILGIKILLVTKKEQNLFSKFRFGFNTTGILAATEALLWTAGLEFENYRT
jgi:hypothetical protein